MGLLTAKGYMLMLWVGYLLAMDEIVYGWECVWLRMQMLMIMVWLLIVRPRVVLWIFNCKEWDLVIESTPNVHNGTQ